MFNPLPARASSRLTYDSPNPALAAKIVNGIASSFVKVNLERRYNATTYAKNFLEDRLTQLKAKLEESEKALVAYAEKAQIVGAGDQQTLAANQFAVGQFRLHQGLDRQAKGPIAMGAGAIG